MVLLGIKHFKERRGGIATEILPHLVDFIEQKERVADTDLGQAGENLARHRADVGATVAADLGLVPYAAQRHAHKLAIRCLGNRLPQ